MLSRLQELRREEETLLRVRAALREQLTRLRVEELALQSMIRCKEEPGPGSPGAAAQDTHTAQCFLRILDGLTKRLQPGVQKTQQSLTQTQGLKNPKV
ncbi:snRNA-activating protein complex subunit 5 isoform X1 [Colius striatus]|uniref:snRNA-activating protein complex subunit 5 isoform X1 n=1 Tax=Colius striatus TaxID=57412 RepID=UPI002B1D7510|nr:snRNA-activating protein complex subunit 5 isoform X1 [Colius striatus]